MYKICVQGKSNGQRQFSLLSHHEMKIRAVVKWVDLTVLIFFSSA